MIEKLVQFATDTATLAVVDLTVLSDRLYDDSDWWADDLSSLPEVSAGEIALVGLSGDGVYQVRVTDQELAPAERAYASGVVQLGLEVVSGRVFVGPGEELAAAGLQPSITSVPTAHFLEVAPGAHEVLAYAVSWEVSPDWYPQPGQPPAPSAPPDVVMLLRRWRAWSWRQPSSVDETTSCSSPAAPWIIGPCARAWVVSSGSNESGFA